MPEPAKPAVEPKVPHLEHFDEAGGGVHRVSIDRLPFIIGRSAGADYIIISRQVSKRHAEIFRFGTEIHVRDLGSTNGTFVNGHRIVEAPLADGDIVHFGHKEFRFGYQAREPGAQTSLTVTDPLKSQLPASKLMVADHLRDLLARHCVRVVFQPIVDLRTRHTIGYEALGRGTHPELSCNPGELLKLAEEHRLARELSQLFRSVALEEAARLPSHALLFFNVHPSEIGDDLLAHSLREFQPGLRSGQRLVLEVHEETVADSVLMRSLRKQMEELGIGIAYDDFGSGQARLVELIEVPPDFVKLHITLIRGIDRDESRQELVRGFSNMVQKRELQIIAEGIETIEEAEMCLELGCHFGQGFVFGRPQPAASGEPAEVAAMIDHFPAFRV